MDGIFSFLFSIFASEYKFYIIAGIIAFLVILGLILFFVFRKDHFSNINGLKIKYNSDNIIKPNELDNPSNNCETNINNKLQEAINSELSSQPLSWDNQMYSFDKYPFVGQKQSCNTNNDCSQISSKCQNGECILKNNNTTVFNVKY